MWGQTSPLVHKEKNKYHEEIMAQNRDKGRIGKARGGWLALQCMTIIILIPGQETKTRMNKKLSHKNISR